MQHTTTAHIKRHLMLGKYMPTHHALVACAVTFMLAACTSTNIQTYGTVDPNAKSITVPAGSSGLKGGVKQALAQRGWKMSVYSGPEVLEGSAGNNTRLKRYDTFNTRYSLLAESRQYDICFNGSPMIYYELALIDTKTGAEVVTMDGQDCQNDVVQQFVNAMEGKSPAAANAQPTK